MKKLLIFLTLFSLSFCQNELDFTTLKSDFTQIVTSQNENIKYSGNFIAHRDLGAFWDYKTPTQKFIYFSYAQIVVVEPDLEQAIITDIKDTPNIAEILGAAKMTAAGEYEAIFEGVVYKISAQNNLPKKITYKDSLENLVTLEFSNTKKDENIDENALKPQIPENFDILKN